MSRVLDWRGSEDPADFVHQAVQALTEGDLVVLPTDTCYIAIASGLRDEAVSALATYCDPTNPQLCILPRSPEESFDFVPGFSPGALRLAKKVWPGPLVIQHRNGSRSSTIDCLSSSTRGFVQTEDRQVRLWQPGNEILRSICRLFSGPIVGGMPQESYGLLTDVSGFKSDSNLLIIDAGAIQGFGAPTLVSVDGTRGKILVPGVLAFEQLQALSQFLILLVCTGNTCRSPMAAALMQKKVLDRFGGTVDSLPICVASAGVSAPVGAPASQGAQVAIRKYGLNLGSHESTQIHSYMIEQADLVLVMGNRHRSALRSQWPEYSDKIFMLAADESDISDPFGGPLEVYEHCAKQLDRHTSYWVDRVDPTSVITWDSRV
jgi:protein-tyrosine-phosphatase/tRNA A37 threonylcarbamoyladenosine synthetase subunit TsaC/SUA5/YrdC